MVLGLSVFVSVIYFAALFYIVLSNTTSFIRSDPLVVMQSIFELLHTISDSTFSFVFSLIMNFVLLFLIFSINIASVVVTELVQSLEEKRTGGRFTNELELNSLTSGVN